MDNQKEAILKVARQIAAANDDEEQASLFFAQIVQALALLDQIAPQFIELVGQYHNPANMQDEHCHLCKLRDAAQDYLDGRQ